MKEIVEAKRTKARGPRKSRRPPYGVTLLAKEREWTSPPEPGNDYEPTEEERTVVQDSMARLRRSVISWIRNSFCMGQFSKCLGYYHWGVPEAKPSLVSLLHKAASPSVIPLGLKEPQTAFHEEWMAFKGWAESEAMEVSLRVDHHALVHAYALYLDVKPSPRAWLEEGE